MKAWHTSLAGILCTALLPLPAFTQDDSYQLGRGQPVTDWLTLGGYFSTEYKTTNDANTFLLDDLALLLYGETSSGFSYLLELESVEPYVADFDADTTDTNFPPTIERLYVDYRFSDQLSIRVGKQITPIGYWNLQPINVLRETTSNPLYSKEVFPKFLTGVDVHGYAPFDSKLSYHVYVQTGHDMDENNINIRIDSHRGLALARALPGGWHVGSSIGEFDRVSGETTRYLQVNSRFDNYRFSFITEGAATLNEDVTGKEHRSESWYGQTEFRFTPQHALIGRIEYQHDRMAGLPATRIGILGYSYRPAYPVSLKFEHQWHDDSARNGIMASFSVLF